MKWAGEHRSFAVGKLLRMERMSPTEATNHYHLMFFQQGGAGIDRACFLDIQSKVDAAITTPAENNLLDVWIESPGGEADATYKIMLYLRSKAQRLRAVIPDYAKSAATLFVLGADEVFMAAAAELGPLDAQVRHPDREDHVISALDIADSLESLAKTAFDLTVSGGTSLRKYMRLPRAQCMRSAAILAARLLEPVVAKLDPHLIHQAQNQLSIAEQYAERMLGARRIKEALSESDSTRLIGTLVKDYPAHGFVISRDEAKRLGLPIRNAEELPRWNQIRDLHDTFRGSGRAAFILALSDASLAVTMVDKAAPEKATDEPRTPDGGGADPAEAPREGNGSEHPAPKTAVRAS